MLRNHKQNIILHTLINKYGIDKETKRDMIYAVTNGREQSSANLTMEECQALINSLNAKQVPKKVDYKEKYKDDPEDLMRKQILSICYEIRWTIDDKIDWHRLNTWLIQYGKHHKALNDLDITELPATVTQFKEVLKHFYDKR